MPRPLLVELVGPPGVGKSTITAALRRLDDRVVEPPLLRRPPYRRGFAGHLVVTAAALARRGALSRQRLRDQIVDMAYVRGHPAVLESLDVEPGTVMVFDQGALYTLTRDNVTTARMASWTAPMLARWTALLDGVVWLDAPDAVLRERIAVRSKDHRLRGASDVAARARLAADRATYGLTLERVAAAADAPAIMRFDTSRRPPDAIAAELLGKLRGR